MHQDINGLTTMYIKERIEQARKDAMVKEYLQAKRTTEKSGPGPLRRKLGRAMIRWGTWLAKAETQPG
jgi:hypothetical protein